MPSASIRKKVCGLIRTTFTQMPTAADDKGGEESDGLLGRSDAALDKFTARIGSANDAGVCSPGTPTSSNSFIAQCIRNNRYDVSIRSFTYAVQHWRSGIALLSCSRSEFRFRHWDNQSLYDSFRW
ncbi:unnamed protein product [Gongylonema pulchrum]|uniref:Secreted protein n=1 Tax=Gongylonema pulchrum TaxID=637853 RepID=A0A183DPY6_9BILA|nr:unnamed protein product [Gongylonema pulchrum]